MAGVNLTKLEPGWTTVIRKRKPIQKKIAPPTEESTNVAPADNPTPSIQRYQGVVTTAGSVVNAIVVPTFSDVLRGDMYYVSDADHFACYIGNKIIHGNIGLLYKTEKNPKRVKDCRYALVCPRGSACNYYHDPLKFPGSRECRNFVVPLAFGTKNAGDLPDALSWDKIMHDILCASAGVANPSYEHRNLRLDPLTDVVKSALGEHTKSGTKLE